MARPPLLQLTDISLTFGGDPVFDGLNLVVQPGDRAALVGRNGSGKSTLMKVMARIVEPDRGAVVAAPGTSVGYMEQDPTLEGFATLGDFASSGLDPSERYKIDMAAEGLKLAMDTPVDAASGGEKRRAALAKLLAQDPDLMLLDEPTNHLDIEAIGWLESHLAMTRSAFIVISHDRAFLTALAKSTLWIDRSVVRRQDKGFGDFEPWRDKTWDEEDLARHKLDRKIKAEARWAVEGISARRKRNQGRVRALGALRKERADMIRRQDVAAMELSGGSQSGKRVIEARGLTKSFGDRVILKPFDLRVLRGDRVAFVGPNGVGKTTLLKMLIGETEPDSGTVSFGTGLEIAVFDQTRSALDPDMSLWESLTGDPEMRVSGRADQVMVRVRLNTWSAISKSSCFLMHRPARPCGRYRAVKRPDCFLHGSWHAMPTCWCSTNQQMILISKPSICCRNCLLTFPVPCCWSAMTGTSWIVSQQPRSRWKAMGAQSPILAVGVTTDGSGGSALYLNLKPPNQRSSNRKPQNQNRNLQV